MVICCFFIYLATKLRIKNEACKLFIRFLLILLRLSAYCFNHALKMYFHALKIYF